MTYPCWLTILSASSMSDLAVALSRPASSSRTTSRSSASASNLATFAEVERDLISRALEACQWNKVQAAAMLKISRKKLYAKINKYRLERPARAGSGQAE